MTSYCVAKNCNVKGGQGYRLFTFPSNDEKLKRKWAVNAGYSEDYKPKFYGRICIKHFLSNQFEADHRMASSLGADQGGRLLKSDAIPTIFDHSLELQKSVSKRQKLQDDPQVSLSKRLKLGKGDRAPACIEIVNDEIDSTEGQKRLEYKPAGTRRKGTRKAKVSDKKRKTKSSVYICALSNRNATHAPSKAEMRSLSRQGLGRKKISLPKNGDSKDVTQKIISVFPKLEDGFLNRFEVFFTSQTGDNRLCFLSDSFSCTVRDLINAEGLICVKPVDRDIHVRQFFTTAVTLEKEGNGENGSKGTTPNPTYFDPLYIKAETTKLRELEKSKRCQVKNNCLLKFSRKPKFFDNICKQLYKMQQDGSFCDVRLRGKDGSVFAHRLILMSSESEWFRTTFFNTKTLCYRQQCSNLDFTKFSYNVLEAFIKYIYTGEIEIRQSDATRLLCLFKLLGYKDVCDVLGPVCNLSNPSLLNMLQEEGGKTKNNESLSIAKVGTKAVGKVKSISIAQVDTQKLPSTNHRTIIIKHQNKEFETNNSSSDQKYIGCKVVTSGGLHGTYNSDDSTNPALPVSNSDVNLMSILPQEIKTTQENLDSSVMLGDSDTDTDDDIIPISIVPGEISDTEEMSVSSADGIPMSNSIGRQETSDVSNMPVSAKEDEITENTCSSMSTENNKEMYLVENEKMFFNKTIIPNTFHETNKVGEEAVLYQETTNNTSALSDDNKNVIRGSCVENVSVSSTAENLNSVTKHEIVGAEFLVEKSYPDHSTNLGVMLEASYCNDGTNLNADTHNVDTKLETPEIPTSLSEDMNYIIQINQDYVEENKSFPALDNSLENVFTLHHKKNKTVCREIRINSEVESEDKIVFENKHTQGMGESRLYSETSNILNVEEYTSCNTMPKSEPG